MTRDAALVIAKKLKALAEKSEAGERTTATKKLKEFCFKHGLDEEEYSLETIKAVIPFAGYNERMLLSSIMCMVLEVDGVKGRVEDNKFVFQCTPRQFDDIIDAFQYYKKVYEDYAEGAMLAIITRNEIKNKRTAPTEFKMEDMTEEERKEYDELINRGKLEHMPPPEQSGDPMTGSFDAGLPPPSPTPNDEQIKQAKKNERIQRMFMVVEQNKWVKKIKAKLFLR